MRRIFTILFAVLLSQTAFSQFTNRTDYDIKVSSREDMLKRCSRTRAMPKALPPEVRFNSRVFGDSVFLLFNSEELFWQFFQNKKDGFAIDIVNQDQFQCDNIQRISGSNTHKGFLLQPVYRDEMKKRMRVTRDGWVLVFGGLVPKTFDKNKIESNYILLEDLYECDYTSNVSVESHGWDLLPMGLYYDTLYKESLADRYRDLEKTLRFTIPFQKNASVYKKEDIKPLYDSLRLTDYEIKAIRIRAFTSVEGSLKRNTELQEERAQSIVSGLQSFQPESIRSDITTAENWVEFLESIGSTSYKQLATMSKDEVKEALKDPKVAQDLEPVLARERKAIIELDLEKRVTYSKATAVELKNFFQKSIADKNVNEALYLQEVVFHKIRNGELPAPFYKELEIPPALEHGSLMLNQISFGYEYEHKNERQAFELFDILKKAFPDDARIDYNICVLRLKAWRTNPVPEDLRATIESLRKKDIPEILVVRLMINYSLIQTEMDLRRGRYQEREKWLAFILKTYKSIKATDADLLSLGHFLSHNSRYDWAEKVLEPRLKDINASSDILFYYLSLTIFSPQNTKAPQYRTIMLNAVNSDRKRFCHIFDPIPQDGVSFQILEDAVLKKTWCENCNLAQQEGVVK